MKDNKLIEMMMEQPATNKQVIKVMKLVFAMMYTIEKTIKPSEELQKESIEYANDMINKQLSDSMEKFKRENPDTFEVYNDLYDFLKGGKQK